MRNVSLTFVYNIYIKEKNWGRLSNSRRPHGDSADRLSESRAAQASEASLYIITSLGSLCHVRYLSLSPV